MATTLDEWSVLIHGKPPCSCASLTAFLAPPHHKGNMCELHFVPKEKKEKGSGGEKERISLELRKAFRSVFIQPLHVIAELLGVPEFDVWAYPLNVVVLGEHQRANGRAAIVGLGAAKGGELHPFPLGGWRIERLALVFLPRADSHVEG